jgi:Nucleotidyl transferase AbiEii toxin, Type IV TA system
MVSDRFQLVFGGGTSLSKGLPPKILPLSSLVAQFQQQPAEISGFPCISLAETAADKIAAFTWRIFDRLPDDAHYDPRTIRHLHDLAYLADYIVTNY